MTARTIIIALLCATLAHAQGEAARRDDKQQAMSDDALLLPPAELPADQRTTQPVPRLTPEAECAHLWRCWNRRTWTQQRSDWIIAEWRRVGLLTEWRFAFANYVYASEGLNPNMVCRGGGMVARGLCDVTERHVSVQRCIERFGTASLFHIGVSVANDVAQSWGIWQRTGAKGWELRRRVFLPAAWNGGRAYQEERRWRQVARRNDALLAEGYREGALAR